MTVRALREEVLRGHGASPDEAAELLAYTEPAFLVPEPLPDALPLPDESYVAAWEGYAAEAEVRGAWDTLRERLVQLRFPVAEGVSASPAYLAATRRGEAVRDGGEELRLRAPERLRLFLHPTAAGRVPVLVAGEREDFVTLVRALARRNEPAPVPASMGACIVGGYLNWDRLAALRRAWEAEHPDGDGGWAAALRALVPRRELYQDRFVLLSPGPYSGVPAADAGVPADTWEELSLTIRLEHECAHHLTRRAFGSMRNTVHDELIADHAGVVAAAGRFRADWALRFLGVDRPGRLRDDARLHNYRGTPPLSDGAFRVLQSVVRAAVLNVEAADAELAPSWDDFGARARFAAALARHTLEELAADGAPLRVAQDFTSSRARSVSDTLDARRVHL